jgi:hypothetical protein
MNEAQRGVARLKLYETELVKQIREQSFDTGWTVTVARSRTWHDDSAPACSALYPPALLPDFPAVRLYIGMVCGWHDCEFVGTEQLNDAEHAANIRPAKLDVIVTRFIRATTGGIPE